jgi:hypothetical protein
MKMDPKGFQPSILSLLVTFCFSAVSGEMEAVAGDVRLMTFIRLGQLWSVGAGPAGTSWLEKRT